MALTFDSIERSFASFLQTREDVTSAAVFGSRAGGSPGPDKWADLDIMIFASEPSVFAEHQEWIRELGAVLIGFGQPNVFETGLEVRILFEGALDVEFLFLARAQMTQLLSRPDISAWLAGGCRVLLDRDGRFTKLAHIAAQREHRETVPVGTAEFQNLVGDFFFHQVWTTKKLLRGELLVAKNCCDTYMKALLVRLIHWNNELKRASRGQVPYGERYFERWADPTIVGAFRGIYARYDSREVRDSLSATCALFSRIARETAQLLGCSYPEEIETRASRVVREYTQTAASG